ncbi:NAD(P)H-hydrate dehydratase [Parashewanella spongiae]|uniref:Bifunctional NAD(P)H-hydrate repair enzyme n=1 Tax=Parashewanella spongiae TaxID=342950 RepID=A0A3A6TGJ7_9GAMM|nr:NAD(P)H-hydrate dehydratase [Parashewanella spongiae]MCL1078476.1 NAD(P)H-hydrate dehydratase [Parashewanella spongiae]RJY14619.1 NAD(P)H-hydrate dehydratase [Parashewanella spongiae]
MTINLPIELYRVEQVRQAEEAMCEKDSEKLYQLVELAGKAAAEFILKRNLKQKNIVILIGTGNNGADGLVLARELRQQRLQPDLDVHVMGLNNTTSTVEFQQAKQKFEQVGGQVLSIVPKQIQSADLIVDALFGIGLSRPLSEDFDPLINIIEDNKAWTISLDVPSGLCANTGTSDRSIRADQTLVFGALKRGLFTYQARHYCGDIQLIDLGLQTFLPEADCKLIQSDFLKGKLGQRAKHIHKGDSGKVTVIGGDIGMPGAVRLCGEACLRAGSGMVAVISRPENLAVVLAHRPELMFCPAEFVDMEIYHRLGWASVLVLGPGLGREGWGLNLFKATLLSEKPIVMDADALYFLSKNPQKQSNWVLTPHSAEAARLLGSSVVEVEADRFQAVKALQSRYGGVVVLKGAGTLICDGEQTVVAAVGNPGLASGGCGDVLSGIIAALIAQGVDLASAAKMGVVVHGYAADIAVSKGERGMVASDLMTPIRHIINRC